MPQGISLGAGDPGLARGQSIKFFFTKLPGLSELASLSHRYCTRQISVHPQEINSLSAQGMLSKFSYQHLCSGKNSLRAIGALSEFFRKTPIFNEY